MEIQFNRTIPAIAEFNAGQKADDERRRLERADFEHQYELEKKAGVDQALRNGFGEMNQPGVQAPSVASIPPPVPTGPVKTAAASTPPGVQVFPQQLPEAPVATPLPPPGVPAIAGMSAGPAQFAQIPKNPSVEYGTPPAPTQVAAPMQAPAPVQPQTQVAAPTPALPPPAAVPVAAQPTPRPNRYAPVMAQLAKTPGGGATMMQLDQQAQVADQRKQAAEIQMMKALLSGEPNIAEAISRQMGLNVPAEVLRNRKFQYEMNEFGKWFKGFGINDDGMAAQAGKQYMDARLKGMDPINASNAALQGLKAAPKNTYDSMRGAYVQPPSEEFPNGRAIPVPNIPDRAAGAGGAGGTSKQIQYAEWRQKTLRAAGVPESEIAKIVAGRSTQIGPREIANLAAKIRGDTHNGKLIYPQFADAERVARSILLGEEPAPAPAPQAPAAPRSSPQQPGTRLKFDINGNRIQ